MSYTTKDEAKLVTQTETGVLVYEKETFTLLVKRLLCKDVRGGGGEDTRTRVSLPQLLDPYY